MTWLWRHWFNHDAGTACLALTASEVSAQSYYGDQNLFFIGMNGESCLIPRGECLTPQSMCTCCRQELVITDYSFSFCFLRQERTRVLRRMESQLTRVLRRVRLWVEAAHNMLKFSLNSFHVFVDWQSCPPKLPSTTWSVNAFSTSELDQGTLASSTRSAMISFHGDFSQHSLKFYLYMWYVHCS